MCDNEQDLPMADTCCGESCACKKREEREVVEMDGVS